MSLTLDQLETPIPVVDLDRLARNLDRAASYTSKHGLALRPHIKTHKSPRIAAEQLRRGAVGLTCATPFEAEVMTAVSDDLLVAYPPVAARASRLAALPETVKLIVALDSPEAIESIAAAARAADRPVCVYIELDLGMHRVGVPRVEDAIELARLVLDRAPLEFEGIAFYPGHVRESVGEQSSKLEQLNAALRSSIEALDRAGVRPPVVSGGSTPTMWR